MTKTAMYWKKLVNKYEQANLSKAEFCKQNRLSIPAFYYWCNKLRPDLKLQNNSAPDSKEHSLFLPVKKETNEKRIDLILSNTIKISFDSLPEPTWIANLIKSMDECNV